MKQASAVARELRSVADREIFHSWLRETAAETDATLARRLGEMFGFQGALAVLMAFACGRCRERLLKRFVTASKKA